MTGAVDVCLTSPLLDGAVLLGTALGFAGPAVGAGVAAFSVLADGFVEGFLADVVTAGLAAELGLVAAV